MSVYLIILVAFSFQQEIQANHNAKRAADSSICGKPSLGTEGVLRISGGDIAEPGAWPWAVAMYIDDESKCGGSIDKIIVIAAHCIQDKEKTSPLTADRISFVAGVIELRDVDNLNYRNFTVSEIVMHPDWHPLTKNFNADIAIAKLKERIIFSDRIKPICLAAPSENIKADDKGFVTGWGLSMTNRRSPSLKNVEVSILDQNICLQNYAYKYLMTASIFCTKYSADGPCQGDSGSALAAFKHNRWILYGIVSFTPSFESCDQNRTVAYTNVTHYVDWIQKHIKDSSLEFQVSTVSSVPVAMTTNNYSTFSKYLQPVLDTTSTTIKSPSAQTCGARTSGTGNENWPWAATIYYMQNVFSFGTLISNSFVITSNGGSTILLQYSLFNVFVVLGDQNLASEHSYQTKALSIIFHPDSKKTMYEGDLALISIMPVEFSNIIQPACLPDSAINFNSIVNKRGSLIIPTLIATFDPVLFNSVKIGNFVSVGAMVSYPLAYFFGTVPINTEKNLCVIEDQPNYSLDAFVRGGFGFFMEIDNKWTLIGVKSIFPVVLYGKAFWHVDITHYSPWIQRQINTV